MASARSRYSRRMSGGQTLLCAYSRRRSNRSLGIAFLIFMLFLHSAGLDDHRTLAVHVLGETLCAAVKIQIKFSERALLVFKHLQHALARRRAIVLVDV